MKNKRNTRRGRAKRWHRHHDWSFTRAADGHIAVWRMAHTGEWKTTVRNVATVETARTVIRSYSESKREAYQRAEAWGRVFRDHRRAQRRDGFRLAA